MQFKSKSPFNKENYKSDWNVPPPIANLNQHQRANIPSSPIQSNKLFTFITNQQTNQTHSHYNHPPQQPPISPINTQNLMKINLAMKKNGKENGQGINFWQGERQKPNLQYQVNQEKQNFSLECNETLMQNDSCRNGSGNAINNVANFNFEPNNLLCEEELNPISPTNKKLSNENLYSPYPSKKQAPSPMASGNSNQDISQTLYQRTSYIFTLYQHKVQHLELNTQYLEDKVQKLEEELRILKNHRPNS